VKTGHRRFKALQKLCAEEPERFHSVRCIVSNADNAAVIQLVENVQREDLSQIDLYNAFCVLREQGLTHKQIAGAMGKSENYIKLLFMGVNEVKKDSHLLKLISSAGTTIQDVKETKSIKNKEERLKLLEQRKKGVINRAKMRLKIKELKGESPPAQNETAAPPDTNAEATVKFTVSPNGLCLKLDFNKKETAALLATGIRRLLMRHQVKIAEQ